jgi:glycosyltransferase involved in cell wall biosynthesis
MQISVVMQAYNAEKYIAEAIDSVLKQTFSDFEFIIINDGSTDNTLSIIKSYTDNRIVLIENEHNFIESLNKGMQLAQGKYIARMDADYIMHVDRLKVQFNIMEEESDITICGTQMIFFGDKVKSRVSRKPTGLIESPLVAFLSGNLILHSTVLIRRDFLQIHKLEYELYPYAEDYKLWTEIAKKGGLFYIEPQALIYYRISDSQISEKKDKDQIVTTQLIKDEIIEYLIEQSSIGKPSLNAIRNNLKDIEIFHFIDLEDVVKIFQLIFIKKENLDQGQINNY